MATLTISPSGQTIEVGEGATLLSALLGAAIPDIPNTCGGEAKCGSCHIFVHEGRKGLSRIAREENERLDQMIGIGSKSRLACQAKVLGTDNIRIEIVGFTSGL